jgi:large subunit ribosomal protein L20
MTRTTNSSARRKRKKKALKNAKGYKWGRKNKYQLAKDALRHAWTHAFQDRKKKKRNFRKAWQVQINAAVRQYGISYSKFIHGIKQNKIELDRKILSKLARKHSDIFKVIVEKAKSKI